MKRQGRTAMMLLFALGLLKSARLKQSAQAAGVVLGIVMGTLPHCSGLTTAVSWSWKPFFLTALSWDTPAALT